MNITSYSVNGFKNLRGCIIKPRGLHAITGCNAVGKTNFMDSLSFLSALMTVSEAQRANMLMGLSRRFESWIPFKDKKLINPEFKVEGDVQVGSDIWEFVYHLKLSKPDIQPKSYSILKSKLVINSESLKAKLRGKPGPKRKIFSRNAKGETTLVAELKRGESNFEVLRDMMAMPAIKVREAEKFERKYPVMSKILDGLSNIAPISLSPKLMLEFNQQFPILSSGLVELNHHNDSSISVVSLFDSLMRIRSNKDSWNKFSFWSKRLLRIDETTVQIIVIPKPKDEPDETRHSLFFEQDSRLLFARELSSGSIILVGLLSILLDPESEGRVFLLEEPEAYLHPKAISDFIVLLQHIAEKCTILISTHNPVVLNSMNVGDVTLMTFDSDHFARTIPVREISSATEALARGYVSFGDLLQTDFEIEDD